MKKLYTLLLSTLICSVLSMAAPYGLLINGSTKIEATSLSEKDFQDREQFLASCVTLNQGDKVQLYDFGSGASWMCAIDPYGEYQKFTGGKTQGYLTCSTAGSYDFYIKLKYEDDMLYIGPASNCSTGGDNGGNNGGNTDTPITSGSSVPSACQDVMLQGFYWDSNQDDKGHGNTRWNTLLEQANEINAYFDLVWLPPSAKSTGGVGYLPKQYNNQNSDWGKRTELENLISAFHNGKTRVVADMVINHIDGKDGWCSFYEQNFGSYGSWQVDGSYICNDDEMNSDPEAGSCNGKATGGWDDGYGSEKNYGAGRDLAHNNDKVREMCRAYAKWMINEMHYDGFRYDYCKGFHTSHIGDYNKAACAYFSVMEYWDGNADVLAARIKDANYNTLTFDFAVKYTTFNNGIAAGNYNGCKAPGLLGKGMSKYSVTFVDSHDSYQRDNNEFGGLGNSMQPALKAKLLQCNAFMLSMPGVPCVFYPHWKEYKAEIAPMILARKAVGVHSESAVSDQGDASGYRATITGTNGTLILELGNRVSTTQSGYTKVAYGDGYAMWIKTNTAVAPKLIVSPGTTTYKTESLKIQMSTVNIGAGTSTIYYTLDGTDPKTSSTRKSYTGSLTISGTVTLKAFTQVNDIASDVYTYTYTYQAPQQTPLTVKFLPPTTWDKVYLYAWDGANLGAWPGMEWKSKDSDGWLYNVFPGDVREVNIIFSNGEGEQSSDILLDQDACYEWDGAAEKLSQNCSLSNIPFQLIVNPEGKTYKTETLSISMSTIGGGDNAAIYYTLDNSNPKETANLLTYANPFSIKGNVTIKAYAESNGQETEVQTHTYTYETPQATPLTIAFQKPADWTKVHLYAWNDGGATLYNGQWPGAELTKKNTEGLYYFTFDASVKEVNFIFNNGSGTQSADLWTDEDVCYGWENGKAKIINCAGTDVEDVTIVSPATKFIRNGQLVILHEGVLYNVMGQVIK